MVQNYSKNPILSHFDEKIQKVDEKLHKEVCELH